MKIYLFLGTVILATTLSLKGEMRTWTDVNGRTMEAEFIRLEGETAIMRRKGNEIRLPLQRISEADRKHIAGMTTATPAALRTNAALVKLAGHAVRRGGHRNRLVFDLPAELLKELPKTQKESKQLHLGIVTPPDFNPALHQQYLWIQPSAEYDEVRKLGNIGAMERYIEFALEQKWTILATDWEGGCPTFRKHDDVLTREAIRLMATEWPGFSKSSFAAAGFNRGAEDACFKVACLAREELKVIGLYLDGCQQNRMGDAVDHYNTRRSQLRTVRVFISNPVDNELAPASKAESLQKSLASSGMRDSKLVLHGGGYELQPRQFRAALKWFPEAPEENKPDAP